jgi:hypothetical protein
MAVILCNKHGRQYCVFASPYFVSLIETATKPKKKLLAVKLELMGEPGFFWCDEDFAMSLPTQANGIDRTSEQMHVRDEEIAFDVFSKLMPVCVKCYEEYLEQNRLSRPETLFSPRRMW